MSSPGSSDSATRDSCTFSAPFPSCVRRTCAAELDSEQEQKTLDTEQAQQIKLKERQKFFEEAFQQDMEQYLSAGYLQITERRGSMSSMEVNVDMLEQMDLMDMSDQEALDVFLNSGGEDNSVASPMLEITLQVPTQAELRHKLSSPSSSCKHSGSQEAGERPAVQRDGALAERGAVEQPDDSDSRAT
ncbi:dystrobrevin binding protein 1b isoform X4 [Scleropages formosus]|uniref:dystrobrevin binding protein 1b isoform X4 n=1 Tax=Scleropages formosus TaxID=113540 RepID=UPI00087894C8|nr:dysbindin-like isoform X4 [Scleropages formosus]